jgi:single-strand DNA-binding protein
MAGETYLTISGNLTSSPKSGMSRHGTAWTRMRIASSSRFFDRQASEWRDGKTLFVDISCWRKLAENAAKTLERGDRVIVLGRLRQRSYEDQQGVRHTVTEMEADAIGPDLGRAPAQLLRASASAVEAPPAEEEEQSVPEAADAPAEPAPALAGAAESSWR